MSDYDQSSLYASLPLFARAGDPKTSREAARKVSGKLVKLDAEFVRCIREIGRPATSQEIAARSCMANKESVRKRATYCFRSGLVCEVGTKKCGVTGQRATAYWITESQEVIG